MTSTSTALRCLSLALTLSLANAFAPQALSGSARMQMSKSSQRQGMPLRAARTSDGSIFSRKLSPVGFSSSVLQSGNAVFSGAGYEIPLRDDVVTSLSQGLSVALVVAALSLGVHTQPVEQPLVDSFPTISEYIPPQAGQPLENGMVPQGMPFAPTTMKIYVTTLDADNKVKDHTLRMPQKYLE
mmetsp:Transcript_46616/g.72972  ORF Transcript_46616/g.72972 Transcript_46616/m.72972 type:complete len:184 (-) Transcript_46616:171-722(-)|eukprot:CAMPEP_0184311508 /NCGR_PEP_ID=MMETSP1049-20130417/41966_1 /TAXON_ID=77928 /ORGANISM="Proteomonas sulcata, Strain CCMP704" /LENGTH=183 /DNA_ID=CAMNT_0026626939 /DNA_START=205 /DNA_END=756 /DNA_ORIENTATION=-